MEDHPPEPPGVPDRRRWGRLAATVPLVLYLLLWLWAFQAEGAYRGGPNGKTFGADFAMFYSAARLSEAGRNPYDRSLLYRTERSFLDSQRLPIVKERAVVRVGNPPLFFWALRPLTLLPFQPAAVLWALLLLAASAAGLCSALIALGWRLGVGPPAAFLAMPPVVLCSFYGNPAPLVFLGVAVAMLLAPRHPAGCGAALTACWLKPPVGLPLALLVLLFVVPHRRRATAAFAATTLILTAATVLVAGVESIPHWIRGLTEYGHDLNTTPDLASLSGLYARIANLPVRTVIEGVTAAAAVGLTVRELALRPRHERGRVQDTAWLWIVWFLSAPYAHFFDEILLAIPVLPLLGRDGKQWPSRPSVVSVYLLAFSLLLISWAPGGVQLLSVPLLGVLWYAYRARFAMPDA